MCFLKSVAQKFLPWIFLAGTTFSGMAQDKPENQLRVPSTVDSRSMTLAVTASDRQHHPISGLKAEDFALFEENQAQQIISVSNSAVPACIGLVVDSSGSMRHKRPEVIHALMEMVGAGSAEDRIFVVNFNDYAFIDQEFTRERSLIQDG